MAARRASNPASSSACLHSRGDDGKSPALLICRRHTYAQLTACSSWRAGCMRLHPLAAAAPLHASKSMHCVAMHGHAAGGSLLRDGSRLLWLWGRLRLLLQRCPGVGRCVWVFGLVCFPLPGLLRLQDTELVSVRRTCVQSLCRRRHAKLVSHLGRLLGSGLGSQRPPGYSCARMAGARRQLGEPGRPDQHADLRAAKTLPPGIGSRRYKRTLAGSNQLSPLC